MKFGFSLLVYTVKYFFVVMSKILFIKELNRILKYREKKKKIIQLFLNNYFTPENFAKSKATVHLFFNNNE